MSELFDAIKSGDVSTVQYLVDQDVSLLDARDEQGLTPILVAVYYGQTDVVTELLGYERVLDIFEASAVGQEERVAALVDLDASLANARSPDGFTPLGLAAFFGRARVVTLLVERGADTNGVSQNDMAVRPIHSAVAYRQPEVGLRIAEALLDAGSDPDVAQAGGITPLHQAAAHGHLEIVQLLLSHQADPSAKDDEGRTAKDLAIENGYTEVARILS